MSESANPPSPTNPPDLKDHPPAITVHQDAVAVGEAVANEFAELIRQRPIATLGLATGGTPVPVYEQWCRWSAAGTLDFTLARTFNLDEYVGFPADHPATYRQFMREQLFETVQLPREQTHFPVADDPATYDRDIERHGGIDLQLLGIGRNGHIAFNEPGCDPDAGTRRVALTTSTRTANARFFDDPASVPTHAVTMGIATILRARRIVVMATGESKRDAVGEAIKGKIDPSCPASFLRRHPSVIWHLDSTVAQSL